MLTVLCLVGAVQSDRQAAETTSRREYDADFLAWKLEVTDIDEWKWNSRIPSPIDEGPSGTCTASIPLLFTSGQ